MIGAFSEKYGTVLQELLAESAGSVIVKTDVYGFIEEASPGLERFGMRLKEMLFKPHLADLAAASHAEALRQFHADVLANGRSLGSMEFPLKGAEDDLSWFTVSLRPAPKAADVSDGALGLLRSIDRRRLLEEELASAALTDTTTGLANSRAFHNMLAQLLRHSPKGSVVVFEVDRLASLKLKFGHGLGDEILWAFGRFLENMAGEVNIVARLDGGRFAMILPGLDCENAIEFADEIIETFMDISCSSQKRDMRLSASAGVANLAGSLDDVLVSAERALVVARALGGSRVEACGQIAPWRARSTGS